MLESFGKNNIFEYKKLTEDEQQKRGILGRLAGVIADTKNKTRNGRLYKKDLWEKVFSNPIMQEKIENRCVLGELGHPENRLETDIEKVAICLAETPKVGEDGKLYGVFDILATPNGKILKTLCDYGCKIGVSSRGEGDVFTDFDGNESVDPDTYTCECWDAVLLPAVKDARPALVTESINSKKSLKQALLESMNEASEDDKKIMKDTLDELDIDLEDKEELEESNNHQETDVYINDDQSKDEAVDNDKAEDEDDLKEALVKINDLENKVISLNEKLSVCYAKETDLNKKIISMKKSVIKLTESLKQEQAKRATSNAKAVSMEKKLNEALKQSSDKDTIINSYKTELKKVTANKKALTESVSNETIKVKRLQENLSNMEESFNEERRGLNEQISSLKKDYDLIRGNYSKKLDKSNKLVEKYKNIANSAVEKYIKSKADMYGIRPEEIKAKLGESYTFEDIEDACNDLREYKVNMNKLPFDFSRKLNESSKIKVNANKIDKGFSNSDDELDPQLMALSGLN